MENEQALAAPAHRTTTAKPDTEPLPDLFVVEDDTPVVAEVPVAA